MVFLYIVGGLLFCWFLYVSYLARTTDAEKLMKMNIIHGFGINGAVFHQAIMIMCRGDRDTKDQVTQKINRAFETGKKYGILASFSLFVQLVQARMAEPGGLNRMEQITLQANDDIIKECRIISENITEGAA